MPIAILDQKKVLVVKVIIICIMMHNVITAIIMGSISMKLVFIMIGLKRKRFYTANDFLIKLIKGWVEHGKLNNRIEKKISIIWKIFQEIGSIEVLFYLSLLNLFLFS